MPPTSRRPFHFSLFTFSLSEFYFSKNLKSHMSAITPWNYTISAQSPKYTISPTQRPLFSHFHKLQTPKSPPNLTSSQTNNQIQHTIPYQHILFIIYLSSSTTNPNTYILTLKEEKTEEELKEDKVSDVQEYKASRLFCFTNDGINVYLELTFFYRLNAAKILDMYLQFGDNWKEGLARISVESIKESSIQFLSKDYFTKRNEINDKLKENLQKSFDEKAEGAATVGNRCFQFLSFLLFYFFYFFIFLYLLWKFTFKYTSEFNFI